MLCEISNVTGFSNVFGFIFKCRLQHVGKLVGVIVQHGNKHEDTSNIDQLVKDLVDDARETVETDENGLDQAEGSSKAQTPGIRSLDIIIMMTHSD